MKKIISNRKQIEQERQKSIRDRRKALLAKYNPDAVVIGKAGVRSDYKRYEVSITDAQFIIEDGSHDGIGTPVNYNKPQKKSNMSQADLSKALDIKLFRDGEVTTINQAMRQNSLVGRDKEKASAWVSFVSKAVEFVKGSGPDFAFTGATNGMTNAPGAVLATGTTLVNFAPSAGSILDTELRKDYEHFVRENELPKKRGEGAFKPYARTRHLINWQRVVQKYNGAGWTERNAQGMSPQQEVWGIATGKIKQ